MSEITEDSLAICGERRRGRPRVPEPQERLSTRLPLKQYDRIVKMAARQDVKVSELVRRILMAQSFLR